MSSNQYPPEFYCKISNEVMKDPVMGNDGHTYEKTEILKWLAIKSESPMTRVRMTPSDLTTNYSLKAIIERAIANDGDTTNLAQATTTPSVAPPQGQSFVSTIGNVSAASQYIMPVIPNPTSQVVSELSVDASCHSGRTLINVRPQVENTTVPYRAKSYVCAVIDVSGSMDTSVTIGTEVFGISVLDLVKHAVTTIIETLGDTDYLALVAFSTTAETVFNFTPMTPAGKANAKIKLRQMVSLSQTNLWGGIEMGLNLFKSLNNKSVNSALIVLTDGEPNVVPSRGHLPMLNRYIEEFGPIPPIHTSGFGYSLDSELLNQIACASNGQYSFISDGSVVGTNFVNSLSNLLTVVASDVIMNVKFYDMTNVNRASVFSLLGTHKYTSMPWGVSVKLGTITSGQSQGIVLIGDISTCDVELKYRVPGNPNVIQSIVSIVPDRMEASLMGTIIEYFRLRTANTIYLLMTEFDLLPIDVKNNEIIKGLYTDISKEVLMALDATKYKKWGVHYFPSLVGAHTYKICTNFKDPGLQGYGGFSFRTLRDQVDTIFNRIPPPVARSRPTPTVTSQSLGSYRGSSQSQSQSYTSLTSSNFATVANNRGGSCVHGDCLALMADGSLKLIKNVVRGDVVQSSRGPAMVKCRVINSYAAGTANLVVFEGGLQITPWHPIWIGGKFQFPHDFVNGNVLNVPCNAVYSFVLDKNHLMTVNGIDTIGLAHGFQEDVAKHEFFGTDRVLEDLSAFEGWSEGTVNISGDNVVRDPITNNVVRFVPLHIV
jgi:Mg-chelatase subunit ChlD